MNYLLDTNIVLTYIRNTDYTQRLEKQLGLFSKENNLIISVVVIGELKSLALQNQWGKQKWLKLAEILDEFLLADIHTEEIINKYAEIDAFSQNKILENPLNDTARNMGKNDLWIAATASVLNLELITMDNDFDHLDQKFIQLNKVSID